MAFVKQIKWNHRRILIETPWRLLMAGGGWHFAQSLSYIAGSTEVVTCHPKEMEETSWYILRVHTWWNMAQAHLFLGACLFDWLAYIAIN